jgi:hypothetical protein
MFKYEKDLQHLNNKYFSYEIFCNNHLSCWNHDYLSFYDNDYLLVQIQEKFIMGGENFR